MMKSKIFIEKLIDCAKNHKTLYVMGCFGAPMTEANKGRYKQHCANYNGRPDRRQHIDAATADTFGFDCVCLIKGILWGWSGKTTSVYGGASYKSNGVPDIGADSMIRACRGASASGWDTMTPGEALWLPGHIGVYIGDGLAVECTPAWKNCVQITAVTNIGSCAGYPGRLWKKHGRLPYVDYSDAAQETQKPGEPKTVDELAREVIAGSWGNGEDRRRRLTAAGYDYDAVQDRVDQLMKRPERGGHRDFINKIGAMAVEDMRKTGILASLTIAQAILESGWGEGTLVEKANNLFSIKGTYNGQGYTCETQEYIGGQWITTTATFRKYPSWAESLADHSGLFLRLDRYANLRGLTDYKLACRYVREDGYATAPHYTTTLIKLIEDYDLTRFDKQALEGQETEEPKKDKTVDELAGEVIAGSWGNGADREKHLTAAGYDYRAVQDRVNQILAPEPVEKTHTTKQGDTLRKIAEDELGSGDRWQEIARLNNMPEVEIAAGQTLKIPLKGEGEHHGKYERHDGSH